jgi:hypothetical protein
MAGDLGGATLFANHAGVIANSVFGADVAREQIVYRGARRLAVVKHRRDLARDRHFDADARRQVARDARGANAFRDVPEPFEDV